MALILLVHRSDPEGWAFSLDPDSLLIILCKILFFFFSLVLFSYSVYTVSRLNSILANIGQ